jgi:hypothetical protein
LTIKDFYLNEALRNEVKTYLTDFLKEEGVRMLMAREEPYAVADAKELIDKAFDNLEVLFSPKVKEKEQINEAR